MLAAGTCAAAAPMQPLWQLATLRLIPHWRSKPCWQRPRPGVQLESHLGAAARCTALYMMLCVVMGAGLCIYILSDLVEADG